MKTTIKKRTRTYRTAAIAVAMVSAGLLASLSSSPLTKPAEAAFPGDNGRIAFASDRTTGEGVNNPEGDFEIFTVNRDGSGLLQLTENAALDLEPAWSPDGRRIVFESDRTSFSNIYVMDADGSGQTQVTTGRSFDRSPTFSPDGRRIAFDSNLEAGKGVSNPQADFEVFSVRLDGTGLAQLTRNAEADFQPDYSPDGRKIAFVSRQGSPGIYTMGTDGSGREKLTRGSAQVFQSPSYAPDGKGIAFASDENGPLDVYRMRADGRGQVRLTDDAATDSAPVFSPNGKRIAFQSNRDGNSEVYKVRADGKNPINLTSDPAADVTPDWQPLDENR